MAAEIRVYERITIPLMNTFGVRAFDRAGMNEVKGNIAKAKRGDLAAQRWITGQEMQVPASRETGALRSEVRVKKGTAPFLTFLRAYHAPGYVQNIDADHAGDRHPPRVGVPPLPKVMRGPHQDRLPEKNNPLDCPWDRHEHQRDNHNSTDGVR